MDESVNAQKFSEAKEKIWVDIISTISEVWPSIEIIFEWEQLLQKATTSIQEIKEELGHKNGESNKIIKVLNSKTRD